MVCPLLRNSDHVIISVIINFLMLAQKWMHIFIVQQLLIFVLIFTIMSDMSHGKISFINSPMLLLLNFIRGFKLKLISLIKNIRSNLIYLHGFQVLILLRLLIKPTSFVFVNRMSILFLNVLIEIH